MVAHALLTSTLNYVMAKGKDKKSPRDKKTGHRKKESVRVYGTYNSSIDKTYTEIAPCYRP